MNENRGLWHGKRSDNSEWIVGVRLDQNNIGVFYEDTEEEDCHIDIFQIDPSTLGECTGLTDKNEKLIFEGDIVKTKKYGKIVGHSNVNGYDIFVVKYEPAVFRLENNNRGFNFVGKGTDYEVIGNIHDNPGLLSA